MTEPKADSADLSSLRIDKSRKARAPGRGSKWLHLLWLLVIPVLYLGYLFAREEIRPTTKVRTATAQLLTGSAAAAELVATGYVVAQVKASVASKATGRLRVLNVEEGDVVRQGDILAILENEDMQADLARSMALVEVARADSMDAGINFQRLSELIKTGSTTQDLVDAATAAYDRAIANLKMAHAGVQYSRVALENSYIRAPFDGTVLTKDADVGEMVAPFASVSSSRGAVVTLADMNSLEVEADVSESNIHKVKAGQPCEITLDAYPTQKYRGFVKKIVPTADRSRATVMVKIAFSEKDERVLPEMSARVNFLSSVQELEQAEPVLTVPKDAVAVRDGRRVVFKVIGGRAEQVEVTVGRDLGRVTEIVAGLSVGDEVVISPPGAMKTGDKIDSST